jgi:hypothetical protein
MSTNCTVNRGADWSQSKGTDEEKESRDRLQGVNNQLSTIEATCEKVIVSGGGGTQGVSDTRGARTD